MSDTVELYQEVILDHNRNPRNFRKMDDRARRAEGYNPLCGDQVELYLKMEKDTLKDISFQGKGCAISTASASLMTEAVKGKSRKEVEDLIEKFHTMLTGGAVDIDSLDKLAVFSRVSEFPMRVKCATLAWHTLRAALANKKETVSTE